MAVNTQEPIASPQTEQQQLEDLELGRKLDQERLAALDKLSRDAFEAGLYDSNCFPQNGSDE